MESYFLELFTQFEVIFFPMYNFFLSEDMWLEASFYDWFSQLAEEWILESDRQTCGLRKLPLLAWMSW